MNNKLIKAFYFLVTNIQFRVSSHWVKQILRTAADIIWIAQTSWSVKLNKKFIRSDFIFINISPLEKD